MKAIKTLVLAALMTVGTANVFAQDISKMSDKELSDMYKEQISKINLDIDQINLDMKQAKLDEKKGNTPLESVASIKNRLNDKKDALKELKNKKKIVDKAIKTKAAAEKAAEKHKKAMEKAEKAARDSQSLRK